MTEKLAGFLTEASKTKIGPEVEALIKNLALGSLLGGGGYGAIRLGEYLQDTMTPEEKELNLSIPLQAPTKQSDLWGPDSTPVDTRALFDLIPDGIIPGVIAGGALATGLYGGFQASRKLQDTHEKNELVSEIQKKQEEIVRRLHQGQSLDKEGEAVAEAAADYLMTYMEKDSNEKAIAAILKQLSSAAGAARKPPGIGSAIREGLGQFGREAGRRVGRQVLPGAVSGGTIGAVAGGGLPAVASGDVSWDGAGWGALGGALGGGHTGFRKSWKPGVGLGTLAAGGVSARDFVAGADPDSLAVRALEAAKSLGESPGLPPGVDPNAPGGPRKPESGLEGALKHGKGLWATALGMGGLGGGLLAYHLLDKVYGQPESPDTGPEGRVVLSPMEE